MVAIIVPIVIIIPITSSFPEKVTIDYNPNCLEKTHCSMTWEIHCCECGSRIYFFTPYFTGEVKVL